MFLSTKSDIIKILENTYYNDFLKKIQLCHHRKKKIVCMFFKTV